MENGRNNGKQKKKTVSSVSSSHSVKVSNLYLNSNNPDARKVLKTDMYNKRGGKRGKKGGMEAKNMK